MWTGAGFVAVTDAALQSSGGFSPYLHTVPPRLAAKHRELLLALGVRTSQQLQGCRCCTVVQGRANAALHLSRLTESACLVLL